MFRNDHVVGVGGGRYMHMYISASRYICVYLDDGEGRKYDEVGNIKSEAKKGVRNGGIGYPRGTG